MTQTNIPKDDICTVSSSLMNLAMELDSNSISDNEAYEWLVECNNKLYNILKKRKVSYLKDIKIANKF